MKIIPLNNCYINKRRSCNSKPSFSRYSDMQIYDNYTAITTQKFIDVNKEHLIQKNTVELLRDFSAQVAEFKKSYSNLTDPNNKRIILEKLVDKYYIAINNKYYPKEHLEKAAAITCELINMIYEDKTLSDSEKFEKITEKKNVFLLKKYIQRTPFYKDRLAIRGVCNVKLMKQISEIINKIGYKEFLPLAEVMCSYNYDEICLDLSLEEFRSINTPARQLLNKHYNLDKLATFIDKGSYYRDGMVETLSKWGLPKHSYLLKNIIEGNYSKQSNMAAIYALGEIGDENNIQLLTDFLFLNRNNIFYDDKSYNLVAFNALSKINTNKSKEIINSYIFSGKCLFFKNNLKSIIRTICRDRDNNCLPKLKKILDCTKNTDTHKVIIQSLCYIKTKEVKDFLISYLEENKRDYKKIPQVLSALTYQNIDQNDYNNIKSLVPPIDEFPLSGYIEEKEDCKKYMNYLEKISTGITDCNRISGLKFGDELLNPNWQNSKYKEYWNEKDYKKYPYPHTIQELNKFAALSNFEYEVNKKNIYHKQISELFAKTFLRSNAKWLDIKENVR